MIASRDDCVLTTTEVVELLEKKCNVVDEAGAEFAKRED